MILFILFSFFFFLNNPPPPESPPLPPPAPLRSPKALPPPTGRRGPGCGRGGGGRAPGPFPAVSAGRPRARALPLADGGGPAAIDRAAVGLHGKHRGAAARLYLHAAPGKGRHAERGRVRDAQCQLPHGAPPGRGLRRSVSAPPRGTRVHRDRKSVV